MFKQLQRNGTKPNNSLDPGVQRFLGYIEYAVTERGIEALLDTGFVIEMISHVSIYQQLSFNDRRRAAEM